MSNTPHELGDEFPEDHDILHKLKMENAHFVTLAERYHDVNGKIHRIETEVEPASDEHSETLKKQRLALLDEIRAMVSQAREAVA